MSRPSPRQKRLPVKPEYIVDAGWPWSSNKALMTCAVCHLGPGVFVLLKDLMAGKTPVHSWCLP